jgi:translocator protein
MTLTRQILGLLVWLGLSFVTAAAGAIASVNAGSFYMHLARPAWAPPAWLFGPMWTSLYVLMGIAAWLVWREGKLKHRATGTALTLFVVQLVVNALWSWLFFVWMQGAMAFAEIVLLLGLIVATTIAFWRIRPLAGALLLPYLLWVTLATALTWSVWQANPHFLG